MSSPIKLYAYQEEHVADLCNVLNMYPCALDFSMLGLGKSYTAAAISIRYQLKVVTIAPPIVNIKWEEIKKRHNVNLIKTLSFQAVRGIKEKPLKHQWLTRRDSEQHTQNNKVIRIAEFRVTQEWRDLVKEGVLLVVDEFQNIKNNSAQYKACHALISEVIQHFPNTKSRVLLLSGSPIDKPEQVVGMYHTLNIVSTRELSSYNHNLKVWEHLGAEAIRRYVMKQHKTELPKPRIRKECVKLAFEWFQAYIKPMIARSMTPPDMKTSLIKRNSFYQVESQEEWDVISDAIASLQHLVLQFKEGDMKGLAALIPVLMEIEAAKLPTFERLIEKSLADHENQKVVACFNFTDSIVYLKDKFPEALVINGSVSGAKRKMVMDKFQTSSNEHRLLLCNIACCNAGIDLDDKDGRFPRKVFVSPTYNTINIYQLCHRFQRADTKSNAEVNMVYVKDAFELRVLNALAKKSEVMKTTTEKQSLAGVLFPCDFPSNFE